LFLTLHGVLNTAVSKFANGFLPTVRTPRVHGRVARHLGRSTFFLASVPVCWRSVSSGWRTAGFKAWLSTWRGSSQLVSAQTARDQILPFDSSHNIGSILIVLLCGFLVSGSLFAPDWRLCFFVPAGIAIVIAVVLWRMLPDTPPSVGLPEFEGTHMTCRKKIRTKTSTRLCGDRSSQQIHLAARVGNFFVYTIRYAVFDWGGRC